MVKQTKKKALQLYREFGSIFEKGEDNMKIEIVGISFVAFPYKLISTCRYTPDTHNNAAISMHALSPNSLTLISKANSHGSHHKSLL